jgi:phosphoribosylformylglycinamidine synthase
VLTESGLLPGALLRNDNMKFVCKNVVLKPEAEFEGTATSLTVPIAHGEGRYYADSETLAQLENNKQVMFRYAENPNGSLNDIAGICNEGRNVIGMMPHPERCASEVLGNTDGRKIFDVIFASVNA